MADDFHLGERCGGQDGLEEPEDPRHEGRDVDKELARLGRKAKISALENGAVQSQVLTRNSG